MSRVFGVKCDRCSETLTAVSASILAGLVDEWGWSSSKVGRSFLHYCEPCQEANEDLKRAILKKLTWGDRP